MTDKIVILCTCGGAEEAGRLAHSLVEARLAACVSAIPQVRSCYRWKGEMETSEEYLLLIKSSRQLFDAVRAHIEEMHSYETPEIVALAVETGSHKYLSWLDANVGPAAEQPE